ncbi:MULTISPECIES: hypothetical protein [Enterobacter]|uniref:Lipoprotein n=1 Tax=Enterobacter bugandensis TaxID=881260 RepID=A0AA42PS14_9ENTR|nr:hypothetical protein [Enterobacter bugandensis]MDH1319656.1 hypothetical protein [Enterobacter bugandensis]
MDNFVRKMVNGLSLVLTILALSGCATKKLKNDIKDHENGRALYSNDVLTAATITESGKGNYSWVFIGNNFDYALTSGASDFLRALVSGKVDKTRVRVSEDGTFMLNKEKNQFSGEITLKYSYRDKSEKMLILNILKLTEWYCPGNNNGAGECEIRLSGLHGTIHQKAQVPADVFQFDHPIKVKFYTHNTLSTKRLLYPAAVATDVVLSPLYLLGGVAVLTVYGVILLH